jgi:hypothetical protein
MHHRRSMLAVAPIAFAAVLAGSAAASTATVAAAGAQPESPRTSALELALAWDVVTLDGLDAIRPNERISVRLPLASGDIDLDLRPHSVRSIDFTVYVQDDEGVREVEAPPVRTYRGSVVGLPESEAYGSVVDGRFTGQFRLGPDAIWTIVEPLDEHDPAAGRLDHVVVRGDDILPHGHECGVDDAFRLAQQIDALDGIDVDPAFFDGGDGADGADGRDAGHVHGPDCNHGPTTGTKAPVTGRGGGTGAEAPAIRGGEPGFIGMSSGSLIEVTDVLIDADFQFFLQNGGSVSNTVADIESVMNGVSLVYERDVDLSWEITGILVRTSSAANPYSSSSAETLLCQLVEEWNQSGVSTIRRDTTHLFTGRELIGTTIGIAFNGVICNVSANSPCGGGVQNLAYGLSQSRFNTFYDARVSLTAHELGHNYNSDHCTGGNCHIMCASVNGCGGTYGADLKFGPAAQSQIESFANSRNCLSVQPAALTPPFEDDFPSLSFNPTKWSWFIDAAITTNAPFDPPSGSRVAELRSFSNIPFRQGDLRSTVIDLTGQAGLLAQFSAARAGLEAGEGLRVEYRGANDRWNELFFLPSDGTDQDFTQFTLPLPFLAYHDGFRIRFRLDGDDFTDRIYLDDIRVGLPETSPCPGDTNDDGSVDFDDLLGVLSAFGPCPAPCPPDFDGNGAVEFDDLLVVLSAFGPCP